MSNQVTINAQTGIVTVTESGESKVVQITTPGPAGPAGPAAYDSTIDLSARNITASGDIIANQITALSDISANGNIAAVNITASGHYKGDFYGAENSTNNYIQFSALQNRINFVNGGTTTSKFDNTFIEFNRPITASGDISASGNLTTNNIVANEITSSGGIAVGGDIILENSAAAIKLQFDAFALTNVIASADAGARVVFGGDVNTVLTGSTIQATAGTGDVFFRAHDEVKFNADYPNSTAQLIITASGDIIAKSNISSTGTVSGITSSFNTNANYPWIKTLAGQFSNANFNLLSVSNTSEGANASTNAESVVGIAPFAGHLDFVVIDFGSNPGSASLGIFITGSNQAINATQGGTEFTFAKEKYTFDIDNIGLDVNTGRVLQVNFSASFNAGDRFAIGLKGDINPIDVNATAVFKLDTSKGYPTGDSESSVLHVN